MSGALAGAEVATPAAADHPATAVDVIAWLGAVGMLLLYSQAWLVPLFGEKIDPSSSAVVRAAFIPAYAVGILLLALKPGATFAGIVRQPFLLLLLGVAAASLAWSVSPDQTIRRAIAVGLTTLGGVALGARWGWRGLAEMLALTFGLLAVVSLILGLFVPSVGRMVVEFPGAWRGPWLEKNTFGSQMAFGSLLFFATGLLRPERRGLWFVMGGLALVMIFASTSKTSLVAFMLGGAALGLALVVRRGGSVSVLAIYGAAVALGGLATAIVMAPDIFLTLLGKDATLSGRTKIWAAVIQQARLQPWLGYGYGAVWDEEGGWGPLAWIVNQAGFKPDHSHNSWLEQWLGLGYVGVGAWALYYLTTMGRTLMAMFRSEGAIVCLPFFAVFSLMTLSESMVLSYNDMRWVMFVAFSTRLALGRRDSARPPLS